MMVYTEKQYLTQGFKPCEVPLIQRHDVLYSRLKAAGWPGEKEATKKQSRQYVEMYELIKRLGI